MACYFLRFTKIIFIGDPLVSDNYNGDKDIN